MANNAWEEIIASASAKTAELCKEYTDTEIEGRAPAYATCATAADVAAKVITTSAEWKLIAGSIITVKFTYTNSASNPTFNVNGTGAKPVWCGTAVLTTSSLSYAGYANRPMQFVYDGTQYIFMGWSYDSNTTYTNVKLGHGYATCSTAAATAAKVGSLSSYTLTTGGIVAVKFTNAVPANATLNINSKGAKAIYYRGAKITAGVIGAGDTATFIYNGSYYHLISIDKVERPNPNKLVFTGAVSGEYDGSEPVTIHIPVEEPETETVLSDNLFDKSIAVTGKGFYHSSSGPTIMDRADAISSGFYAYVPLRGAGTYRTVIWWSVHGEAYAKRVPILKEDKTFIQNLGGTLTTIDSNYAYLEFTVTEEMVSNGAALYAFDGAVGSNAYQLDTVMIVKNRDYPSEYLPYGYIEVEVDSGNVSDKHDNILKGKTALFFGDSICAGTTTLATAEEYGYGWAGLIGTANGMTWGNYGRNGAVITSISGQTRIVTDQIDTAFAAHSTADYIIFEGGTNDADQLKSNSANLGTVTATNFSSFDTTTFSGAFEALILKILTKYPDAKVGYIVAQKMGLAPYDSANSARRQYFDRAIEICQKWGIPYIDLWNGNPLNPALSLHYDSSLTADEANTNGKYYTDGQHLTLAGYQRVTPQIEAFMRSL